MADLKVINECEVCESKELIKVLDLGDHPMCDDLKPIGSDITCKNYPIQILFCETCKTAHQKYQIPKQDLFPAEYHYRARFTKDVLGGMEDLVNSCEQDLGILANKVVLDIGCNDGSLLNFFKKKGATCIGVEPTKAALDADKSLDKIFNNFFDFDVASKIKEFGNIDIITFTNVFAHIEDLNSLLKALSVVVSDNTTVVIENHYLGKVLQTYQFDTFYHEHPRTYSANSFKYIANKLKLGVHKIEFPSRYGGNIRVFMNKAAFNTDRPELESIFAKEDKYIESFTRMNEFIKTWRESKKAELVELKNKHSHLYGKAFPGRAAILIRLLDIDRDLLEGVFEQDCSVKIGNLVPGTKIPIIKDSQIKKINPTVIINLAWHIKEEIERYLQASGYTGEIRHIL